ncbi:MAG TPA: SRPBCC family protein, partial [Gemmatimonadaceae bacterium]
MRTFTTSIDVAAPPSRVYSVMIDIDRWPEWTRSVSSVKRLGDTPFDVGTKVLVRQPKLPPAVWKVSSIEPNRSFTWIGGGPGIHVTAKHSVEPAPGGSRVTLYLEYRGLIGDFFAKITERITRT